MAARTTAAPRSRVELVRLFAAHFAIWPCGTDPDEPDVVVIDEDTFDLSDEEVELAATITEAEVYAAAAELVAAGADVLDQAAIDDEDDPLPRQVAANARRCASTWRRLGRPVLPASVEVEAHAARLAAPRERRPGRRRNGASRASPDDPSPPPDHAGGGDS